MQVAALLVSAALAVGLAAPASTTAGIPSPKAEVYKAEVYVAVLDGDWTVARELRLPCDAALGCAADLDGPVPVHVRFDPLGGGTVAVSSRIADADGPDLTLALDARGFGATHVETAPVAGRARILMLAVQAPGLAAPAVPIPAGAPI